MPEVGHMTQAASKPLVWRLVAFGYVVVRLIVYPAILIALQDFPHLPKFGFGRYFEPTELSHFRYENVILALGFIVVFVFGFGRLFAQEGKSQFIISATILSVVFYEL